MMINNFFINLILLLAVIFLAGHVSKDRPFSHDSGLGNKFVLGAGGGALGIGMMIYTIMVTGTSTIIDLRVMPVMLTYYVGGLVPSLIASVIILSFRMLYYGVNYSAAIGALQIIMVIPVYLYIDRFNFESKKRWTVMVSSTMVILVSTVYYLLHKIETVFTVLSIYSMFYLIAFVLAYKLLTYVQTTNELYRRYKREASKDFLTDLNNTRQFDITFSKSVENAVGKHEHLSCLMLDIDHFKRVNDEYGHAAGNIVLRELAKILKRACRSSDIISRVGGEEFCVLLKNCSFVQAQKIAYEICQLVSSNEFSIGNKNINVTVSIGISAFPETVDTAEELLEQADQALYNAKNTGRNKVCMINP